VFSITPKLVNKLIAWDKIFFVPWKYLYLSRGKAKTNTEANDIIGFLKLKVI